jgi:hypothetical protein
MAGTTRLELSTSAVTEQKPEVTDCNLTAPIATFGALRNPRELLLHPNCTQILAKCLLRRKRRFKRCILGPSAARSLTTFAYLSTVLAEFQRHVRFALAPGTRINHAEAGISCHQNSPNARDDSGLAELYDASRKPVQD